MKKWRLEGHALKAEEGAQAKDEAGEAVTGASRRNRLPHILILAP